MKTKLIHTQDYLLLIDENVEIKAEDWLINLDNIIKKYGKPFKHNPVIYDTELIDTNTIKKIIAYYPITKEAKELDLPLLPDPFGEVDIEKLAKDRATILFSEGESSANWRGCVEDFMVGYKAAQSKQFTLDDVKKAIEMAREYEFVMYGNGETEHKYSENEIIQSLYTQKLPKEFIPEYEIGVYPRTGKQAKRIKTTTNSQGKETLVGTYKY